MNVKSFTLFLAGLFAVVLLASFASAAATFVPTTLTQSVPLGETSTVLNFQVNATAAHTVSWAISVAFTKGTLTLPTGTALATGLNSFQVTLSGIPTDFTGPITGTITVSDTTTGLLATLPITVTVTAPAELVTCINTLNGGNLDVKKIDFTNNGLLSGTQFGKDDEWFPLEKIDVQIDVKNVGDVNNDKVNNIKVNWGLYDTSANQWVIEPVDENDFDLKEGKTNTQTISFSLNDRDIDVDLSDLSDGDNYRFYVFAEGETDDGLDTPTCISDSKQVSVVIESDFVVLNSVQAPETFQCGETAQITADAWNIGDSDQDAVSVELTGRESALKLSQIAQAGDIGEFDNQAITFQVAIPSDIAAQTYNLQFEVKDEDGNTYQNDFNDDDSIFTVPITVTCGSSGTSGSGSSTVSVSAVLASEAQAGKDLVVKTTIKNTGTSLKTFTVGASDFASWADSVSADQTNLVLNAGESRDVTLTFDVNRAASGPQTFFVETVSGTEVTRQPVSVTIAPATGLGAAISNALSGGNSLIWVIGALNLILVIVIIFVAVRIARK